MEILRPLKNSETIIKINSPLNKEFINAFCHRDFDIIEKHLSKNGRFYGFSKTVFILKLKAALNRFDSCISQHIFGKSLGWYPGELVHEFTYTKQITEHEGEINTHFKEFNLSPYLGVKPNNTTIVFQMIFRIEDGEIIEILKPNKFVNFLDVRKLTQEN
jgi:hypothetical protein